MTNKPPRASMFGDEADEGLDIGALKPGPIHRSDPEASRRAAEADGFVSREPLPPRQDTRRRHRTGRTVQVNIKMSEDYKARFTALADRTGASLNVTFERAIEALERGIDRAITDPEERR
ncbi:MAG: ribbon-helix-helix protein, CopG family [Caulobacteraceae bacterium]|nr:ribbon-helix-helix protein, CopG family [Caulobacteraceae bacterium]